MSDSTLQVRQLTAWFDTAEQEITAGLGDKKDWSATDEARFDIVLGEVKSALRRRAGSSVLADPAVQPAIQTMASFLLQNLAARDPRRALWEIDAIRETNLDLIFESRLILLQAVILEGNKKLAVDESMQAMPVHKDRHLRNAETEHPVPAAGIGKLAHDRLITFMQRFSSPPPAVREAA